MGGVSPYNHCSPPAARESAVGRPRRVRNDAVARARPLSLCFVFGSPGRTRASTHHHVACVCVCRAAPQVEHMIWEKTILEASDHPFIVFLACTFQGERASLAREDRRSGQRR